MFKEIAATFMAAATIVCSASVCSAAQNIALEVNHSQILRVSRSNIVRVAVANPAIADVVVIDNTNINVVAKEVGSTNLMVWTNNGLRQDYNIIVMSVDENSAEVIRAIMDLPDVNVEVFGTGSNRKVILSGFVEDQIEMDRALTAAAFYTGSSIQSETFFEPSAGNAKFRRNVSPNVINRIEMRNPKQVNLSIVVLDVGDVDRDKIGFQYGSDGASDNSTTSMTEAINSENAFYAGMNVHDATGKLFTNINGFFQMQKISNDSKVLSRPNVTTMSGQEASIMIGGQVPFSQVVDNKINTEWKNYGIQMHINPTVNSLGDILTNISAEVSSLDSAHSVTNAEGTIPAIITRTVSTSVIIPNGHTMAIGGLMNNSDSTVVKKFPILGDIPIIGELFKHTSKENDKREIVILITPTLIQKEDQGKVNVDENLQKAIESTQRDFINRTYYDWNDPPTPEDESKMKKDNAVTRGEGNVGYTR